MSFYYYKVPEEKKQAKVYGFKKVEQRELDDITERISRPTSRQRTPSACQRRPESTTSITNPKFSRRFTDREFSRMIRRLRKPTFSSRINQADFDSDFLETTLSVSTTFSRPKTAEERTKSLENVCRPTTASSFKAFDKLKYTGENYNNHDYEYVYASPAPPEEIDVLIDRVSRTTIARANGRLRCGRSLTRVESELELRKTLPLVSGLPKSRTVDEIVERLYKPLPLNRTQASSVS